jgi:DNA modification methylase
VTGFEAPEIDALFADLGPEPSESDEALPPVEKCAVSRPGDLWLLGHHRLLNGDARSQPDMDRLMGGSRARMVCADPPYNTRVAEVQGRGRIKRPEFACASGERREEEYIGFLEETLGHAVRASIDGALHYVVHDWRCSMAVNIAGRRLYGAMLNLCVWAKTCAGQGSFYRSQHELVGVFQVGGGRHQNNVCLGRFGRNRSNLWTYAGMAGFGPGRMELLALHPTVKPVALVADAMRDCTTRGDIVLDPFMGSGTTIVAAEKVGRRGYGIELEPRYIDVAIRRWQVFTRGEAVLEADGRTFAQIQAARRAEPGATGLTCDQGTEQ